jgi:hypothetical protein
MATQNLFIVANKNEKGKKRQPSQQQGRSTTPVLRAGTQG